VPVIEPFRALCYAPRLRRDLSSLIAPPYDVIPEEQRDRFASSHPNNMVHLDLPREQAGDDRYGAAARRLQAWVHDRILIRDEKPAVYPCEQRFRTSAGDEWTRRGFFARLHLEAFDSDVVFPHERTLVEPRSDRESLLVATRTHLSAVFLLHPDPGGTVSRVLEEALGGETFAEARDAEGTLNRVVRVEEGEITRALQDRLRDQWALIADGHHRYEASLKYRDERRSGGRRDAETLLAYFCGLEDPGLRIFPIHRLVHSIEGLTPERFRERLSNLFNLRRVGGVDELRTAVASGRSRPGVFGILFRGESGGWVAEWKDGSGLDRPPLASVPPALRQLDVILLHRLILEDLLGITPEAQAQGAHLDYVKDENRLLRRMDESSTQIGFLLNPTRMEQVVEVTRQGLRLPQKTTYFHPKVQTGLVLSPLDD
jgi:uncharacterized protein (DUF1015 family)